MRSHLLWLRAMLVAAFVPMFGACATQQARMQQQFAVEQQGSPRMLVARRAMAAPARVSDANVAAMVLTADNVDLSFSRLAVERAQHAAIKAYAQRVITDFSSLGAATHDVADEADVSAMDNATTRDLRDMSTDRRTLLREHTGASFDSAYIATEIQYNQQLLSEIDDVLMPSSSNGRVRQLLAATRPIVVAHLAAATQLSRAIIGVEPFPAVPPHVAQRHLVRVAYSDFMPAEMKVSVGDTVVWLNQDIFPHAVLADAGTWLSPELSTNQSWRLVATRKGRFTYHCSAHPGMKAVIVVE